MNDSLPLTVCHFPVNDTRGGSLEKKMTKCDMGEGGRGLKNGILPVTYFSQMFFSQILYIYL